MSFIISPPTSGTFTPTVTLVGGAGNTTPVYSTNSGRYTRIGNRVFVDIFLDGDGGNEGAGTGVVTIELPFTSSASQTISSFPCGRIRNGASSYVATVAISTSVSTISVSYYNTISTTTNLTGADQNNTTRSIRLQFSYEVD